MENNVKRPRKDVLEAHVCTAESVKTLDQALIAHVHLITLALAVNMNLMPAKLVCAKMEQRASTKAKDTVVFALLDLKDKIATKTLSIVKKTLVHLRQHALTFQGDSIVNVHLI